MKPDDTTPHDTPQNALSGRSVGDLRAQNPQSQLSSEPDSSRGQVVSNRSYLQADTSSSSDSASVSSRSDSSQQAAAELVRSQIDRIYDQSTDTLAASGPVNAHQPSGNGQTNQPLRSQSQSVTPPAVESKLASTTSSENPYEQTMGQSSAEPAVSKQQSEQWSKYHSAWQEYYQKYYELYYVSQLEQTTQKTRAQSLSQNAKASTSSVKEPKKSTAAPSASDPISKDQALKDLRSQIRGTIEKRAQKARNSRHFIPIMSSVVVAGMFIFLQYNQVFGSYFKAYAAPSSQISANPITDPTPNIPVDPAPTLMIPKINVDTPVDYSSTPDYDSQMAAMKGGLAYFGIPGANSKPGQVGNTVLSGHSSNDLFDDGAHKFVFVSLEKLEINDTIFVNYESQRYVYSVTKKEVVKPTDVQALVYPTDKPILTLITCTPLGTSTNRLLVTAEQISPDPSAASEAPAKPDFTDEQASIPGNTPSFLQRLLGIGSN